MRKEDVTSDVAHGGEGGRCVSPARGVDREGGRCTDSVGPRKGEQSRLPMPWEIIRQEAGNAL